MGLFYSNNSKQELIGYADAGHLSDPHKAKSQTGYVFTNNGTAISWRSQKQTLVTTSSNHSEIIALHEASRECVWIRSMTHFYEDNAACISQLKEGYIKSDKTNHIPPRLFSYTHELIKDNHIDIKYIQSSKNSADLFTKALPTTIFRKHVHDIGMRHLHTM